MIEINNKLMMESLKITHYDEFNFSTLGLSNSDKENTLTFLDDFRYLSEVISNEKIKGIFTSKEFKEKITELRNDLKFFIVTDPRYSFYSLQNYLTDLNFEENKFASKISPTAQIHPTSFVSELNVIIGDNVIIYPNVTILSDVEIGKNCVIQSGAIIGSEGFEHKRTSKGILSVCHDGKVIIKENVYVGSNTCIDKGFSFRNTIIESNVKIDNLIHVAHGVLIQDGAFIIAGTVLGGSSIIENDAWLSINTSIAPGITVKKKGFVSIGSVVTKDVVENQQVTGNFAIPHEKFLQNLKKSISQD